MVTKNMVFVNKILLMPFVFVALLLSGQSAHAVEMKYHPFIERFINDVKNRDIESMSSYIAFPFKRRKPIPSIQSKEELELRFDELFDSKLIEILEKSDLDKDWNAVGWRGIMLNRGIVWIDYDGRLLAINHQSNAEKQKAELIIEKEKSALHKSIKNFDKPVLSWETSKFKIRVDDLGGRNYRYASWGINKKYSDKPDLVLHNGELVFEGSGGNRYYKFKNGKYSYRLYINSIGTSSTPVGELDVFKADERVLHDEVVKVVND